MECLCVVHFLTFPLIGLGDGNDASGFPANDAPSVSPFANNIPAALLCPSPSYVVQLIVPLAYVAQPTVPKLSGGSCAKRGSRLLQRVVRH